LAGGCGGGAPPGFCVAGGWGRGGAGGAHAAEGHGAEASSMNETPYASTARVCGWYFGHAIRRGSAPPAIAALDGFNSA
jgi:hypothetical protein